MGKPKPRTVTTIRYGAITLHVYFLYHRAVLVSVTDSTLFPKGKKSKGTMRFPAGTIFVSYREKNAMSRTYHVYPHGIYSALRGRRHTLKGYGKRKISGNGFGECEEIEVSATTLCGVVERLLSYHWLTGREKGQLKKLLAYVSALLRGKKNELKKAAFEKLSTCVSLRDSIGRVNPGATSAKITAARYRLLLRLNEIQSIVPHIVAWELALEEELNRSLTIFKDTFHFCGKALKTIRSFENNEEPQGYVRQIQSALAVHMKDLQSVIVYPLRESAYFSWRDLERAQYHAKMGHRNDLVEVLDRVSRAMRFKFAQLHIEEMISWFDDKIVDSVSEEVWEKLEVRINDFHRRAKEKLDDSGFRTPVWNEKLINYFLFLASAVRHRDRKQTREYLKRISSAL